MKNKELLIKGLFWSLWSVVLTICVFYIVKNAQWTIGDDSIVMRHTGSGKPFPMSHMINRSIGRFCPLAYMAYNVLLLFYNGNVPPKAHYALEASFFVIFAIAFTVLLLRLMKNYKPLWKYSISFFGFLLCIGRAFPQFTECFSTAWCFYTLVAVFLLFSFLFHEKQNWVFGILALLFANIICYSSEVGFVLPLGIGGFALLFNSKDLSKKEKTFDWILVGSALLFLTVYLVFIVPYVNQYATHVIETSMIGNALRMFYAQKIIVVGFFVFIVRLVLIIFKKQPFDFFDAVLLTAFADFCACAILKLDWTLYYNTAALLCVPSIVSCLVKYVKPIYVLVFISAMGAFYGMKIPKAIKHSQGHRETSYSQVVRLANAISKGTATFWWMPDDITEGFQYVFRECKRGWLDAYLTWYLSKEDPILRQGNIEKDSVCSGIWLMISQDKEAFFNEIGTAVDEKPFFKADSIYGYVIGNCGSNVFDKK